MDVMLWLEVAKWIFLAWIAWWYYTWVREKLAFSPLLTIVVAGIVVYYLVIEHPVIGSIGVVGWVILMSGILYLLPMVTSLWNTFFQRR